MEDFIVQLKNNIKKNSKEEGDSNKSSKSSKSCNYRNLLYHIIASSPQIKLIDKYSPDGDIKFEVSMKSIGISSDTLIKYKKEFYSEFVVDFVGELLIRENINRFAKILVGINPCHYPLVVDQYEHKKFGMGIFKDKLIFKFHISLLQTILTEDLNKTIE